MSREKQSRTQAGSTEDQTALPYIFTFRSITPIPFRVGVIDKAAQSLVLSGAYDDAKAAVEKRKKELEEKQNEG